MDVGNITNKGPLFGVRHVQVLLLLFNKIVIYYGRTHIPVIVVAMTDAEKSNPEFKEYNWNEKQQFYILSSLFWGFLIGQLPVGYLMRHFSVGVNLFIVTFCAGIVNGLIPLLIDWGDWQLFCGLRFIQGIFMAGANPLCFQHLSSWSPPEERNRLGGLIFMGLDIGAVVGMTISGIISESHFGWPGAIYMFSILCFFWCILWLIFGSSKAKNCKYITETERNYIEQSLKGSVDFEKLNLKVPWRAIFTSIPFWCLVNVRATEGFSYYTTQVLLPSYMSAIFQLNIKANAIYSALPYVLAFTMTFVFMALSDFIRNRNILAQSASRKLFNSLSMWIPAIGVISIAFLDAEQQILAIVIITIAMGISSAVTFGGTLSCLELAPNYTEVIVVIVDFGVNVGILLGPLTAGWIINDKTNRNQWQIVFAIIAAVYCVGDLIFLIWGTSNVQPWNDPEFVKKKIDKNIIQS